MHNGLLQRQQKLQCFLNIENIDICLVSVTYFTKQNFISFKGYNMFNAIHQGNCARGGSAILIKQKIWHHEKPPFETPEIQSAAVTIKYGGCDLKVAALYSPPRYSINKSEYINYLKNVGKTVHNWGRLQCKA